MEYAEYSLYAIPEGRARSSTEGNEEEEDDMEIDFDDDMYDEQDMIEDGEHRIACLYDELLRINIIQDQ